jgi:hypothetical protein
VILSRSWKDGNFYYELEYDSHLIILKRLVDGGILKNNREMGVNFCRDSPSVPLIFRSIHSMTHLEKLSFPECQLTEDLPKLFQSCPKLTELRLRIVESQKSEMNEKLKNELRPGFQRLRLVELQSCTKSGPVIPEILT